MEAGKLWLLKDFIGKNKILFRIPVYQRNYDWSEQNCKRLLDDIRTIIDCGEKHFLGTIVFMQANGGGFSLSEYTIIDGQQRLTTSMLLLKALADVAKTNGDYCSEEIDKQYLHNQYCAEEYKIKLKPIKSDNDQFTALLKDNFSDVDEYGHIYLNYMTAKNRFEQWVNAGTSPAEILGAMEKLEIVEIVLTKGEDDPQVIFESINSTGLDLSNSDLIRNFLLMNTPDQEKLYENYWLYIEALLKKGTDYSNLNAFFLQYLIFRTTNKVESTKVYEHFVRLFKEKAFTHEECLQELKYYAEIYKAFVSDDTSYSKVVRKNLANLRQLKQTTCYPFLLHVFDDFKKGVIREKELDQITTFLVAYLVRRMVCGVPSNSLRGLFNIAYNRIFKVETNKQHYYDAINKFIFTEVSDRDTMPSDVAFKKSLLEGNMYSNSVLCKYLLKDIENGDGKEVLDFSKLTIEHIMPQTQSMVWMHIKPEDHGKYLHVLGNLTITGYNSELGNKPFKEKKTIISENSKAVILNSDVLDKGEWNVTSITNRGQRLASIVMSRYDVKETSEDIPFEYLTTMTLDDADNVTGKKLVRFTFCGETFQQTKFALMVSDVIKLLDKKQGGVLEDLADKKFKFSSMSKHPHISRDKDELRNAWELKEGIYMESNLSASSIMKFVSALLDVYGIDHTLFNIQIVAEAEDEDIAEEDE